MGDALDVPLCFLLLPLKFSLISAVLIMVCLGLSLGSSCLGLSVLTGPGYLFLSLG